MRLELPIPARDDAEFSKDGTKRYWLSRGVPQNVVAPIGLYIGLNPSTAGAEASTDDPTVRKWRGFSQRFGWSGFWACNAFAHIETYSKKLQGLSYAQLVGEHNDSVLRRAVSVAGVVVVCWGRNVPVLLERRIDEVMEIIRTERPYDPPLCFGRSKDGHPLHPLTLGYDTPLEPYVRASRPRASRR